MPIAQPATGEDRMGWMGECKYALARLLGVPASWQRGRSLSPQWDLSRAWQLPYRCGSQTIPSVFEGNIDPILSDCQVVDRQMLDFRRQLRAIDLHLTVDAIERDSQASLQHH
jgi:hypothetical protein